MSFKDVIKALTFKDILEGMAGSILVATVIYVMCIMLFSM